MPTILAGLGVICVAHLLMHDAVLGIRLTCGGCGASTLALVHGVVAQVFAQFLPLCHLRYRRRVRSTACWRMPVLPALGGRTFRKCRLRQARNRECAEKQTTGEARNATIYGSAA